MQLKNKTAIVSGVSSGLGAALAQALVEKGATVYGLARNTEKLATLQQKLGASFLAVPMDITNKTALHDWITATFHEKQAVDILINNAGIGSFQKFDELSIDAWEQMVNTNLNGMFYLTSSVVPFLKENPMCTHIVNIGSILGTMGRAEGAAYCTTKYGVSGFSDALFRELRFFNIKVTCVNPGSIATDFFSDSGIQAHANMLDPDDLAATVVHVLETPDNFLINELTARPLNPKQPKNK